MILQKLDDALFAKKAQMGRNCTLIVMHPITWQKLLNEIFDENNEAIYNGDTTLGYCNITVMRSLDIEQEIFEIR
jgi:hypothetical protein